MAEINFNSLDLSAYATLMDAFNNAQKARIDDFPKLTQFSSSHTKCIVVDKDNPFKLIDFVVGRFSEITKGSPSKGPLFPATPDEETISIAMTSLERFNTKKDNETMIDFISKVYHTYYNHMTLPRIMGDESGDLKTISYASQIEDYTNITTFRKSGSEYYFHELAKSPSYNHHVESYGYCYIE